MLDLPILIGNSSQLVKLTSFESVSSLSGLTAVTEFGFEYPPIRLTNHDLVHCQTGAMVGYDGVWELLQHTAHVCVENP